MTPQRQAIVDTYAADYPEMIFLEGPEHDAAILGVLVEPNWGRLGGAVVCYDAAKLIELVGEEHFSFNTAGGFYGPYTPLFLYRPEMP